MGNDPCFPPCTRILLLMPSTSSEVQSLNLWQASSVMLPHRCKAAAPCYTDADHVRMGKVSVEPGASLLVASTPFEALHKRVREPRTDSKKRWWYWKLLPSSHPAVGPRPGCARVSGCTPARGSACPSSKTRRIRGGTRPLGVHCVYMRVRASRGSADARVLTWAPKSSFSSCFAVWKAARRSSELQAEPDPAGSCWALAETEARSCQVNPPGLRG